MRIAKTPADLFIATLIKTYSSVYMLVLHAALHADAAIATTQT